jgi:hypothetical protein
MKRTILSILISNITLSLFAQINCLKAEYPFSGNANDISINLYHGTVNGSMLTSDRFSNPNSAYSFDGIDDNIALPTDFDFQQRTISLWFNADAITTTSGVIYESDHNGIQYGQTLFFTKEVSGNKKLRMLFGESSNQIEIDIIENEWYHAAIIVDSNIAYYYLNGSKIDSVTNMNNGHSANGNAYASLGRGRNGNYPFMGQIDDVSIYDCALDDSIISSVYNYTNIENLYHQAELKLYPNPASNFIKADLPATGVIQYWIYDYLGRIIINGSIQSKEEKIDIKRLNSGFYFLQIDSNEHQQTIRFIKN